MLPHPAPSLLSLPPPKRYDPELRALPLRRKSMATSSQRPPPALDELRAKAHDSLASLRPTQFSVRAWSRAAQAAFDHAEHSWREGRANADRAQVAEAFLDFKRAAG